MAVITTANVAAVGRIGDTSATGSSPEALITTLINSVQRRAERYCSRVFDSGTYTEYHDADGTQGFFFVRCPPITAIAALTHNEPIGAQTINHTADVRMEAEYLEEGVLRLHRNEGVFYQGRGSIKIVYTGGWSTSTVPDDLALALVNQVLFELNHPERIGVSGARGDGASADYDERGGFAAQVADVLDGYVLRRGSIMP